jgi:Protein of unknown function (DUF3099)
MRRLPTACRWRQGHTRHNVEVVRSAQRSRRDQAHLVTEARPGLSADIAYRERRYLIMMGIRTVCFVTAIVMFVNHLGWLTAIPVVGALIIPYFAVIFANGGREPTGRRGFRPYEPKTPDVYRPPGASESGQAHYVPPAE